MAQTNLNPKLIQILQLRALSAALEINDLARETNNPEIRDQLKTDALAIAETVKTENISKIFNNVIATGTDKQS